MTLKFQGTIIELFIKTTLYYVTVPSSVKIVNVLYIVGQKRIEQLRWNTQYFRKGMREKGFIIYGNDDSPVVPLLIFFPTKLA
jgi:serine palmitoyltransferase